MYKIFYWFGRKVLEYRAFCESDRDSFLESLKRLHIKVLAVKETIC